MKVKCIIQEYYDRELKRYVKKDETLEMKPERAKFLIGKGFVEEVKKVKESKETK